MMVMQPSGFQPSAVSLACSHTLSAFSAVILSDGGRIWPPESKNPY